MLVIIDYKTGNLGSIQNILKSIGIDSIISNDIKVIKKASKLILPGVGAFDTGIKSLKKLKLIEPLNYLAKEKCIPILGICLGAQLMTKSSEEGSEEGLAWFNAKTIKFNFDKNSQKNVLPNIGWRDVFSTSDIGLKFLEGINDTPRFYFVHSYHFQTEDSDLVAIKSNYAYEFPCCLSKNNLHCVQFHPEKSHRFGKYFLKNFVNSN